LFSPVWNQGCKQAKEAEEVAEVKLMNKLRGDVKPSIDNDTCEELRSGLALDNHLEAYNNQLDPKMNRRKGSEPPGGPIRRPLGF